MPKPRTSGHLNRMRENRLHYKVLNDDVVIFRRHDRMYRLSNLANNWLPGKLFVLVSANIAIGRGTATTKYQEKHGPVVFGTQHLAPCIWLIVVCSLGRWVRFPMVQDASYARCVSAGLLHVRMLLHAGSVQSPRPR